MRESLHRLVIATIPQVDGLYAVAGKVKHHAHIAKQKRTVHELHKILTPHVVVLGLIYWVLPQMALSNSVGITRPLNMPNSMAFTTVWVHPTAVDLDKPLLNHTRVFLTLVSIKDIFSLNPSTIVI